MTNLEKNIIQFNERYDFEKRNCAIVGCSTDTAETHWGWLQVPKAKGGIQGITYPLIADSNKYYYLFSL